MLIQSGLKNRVVKNCDIFENIENIKNIIIISICFINIRYLKHVLKLRSTKQYIVSYFILYFNRGF